MTAKNDVQDFSPIAAEAASGAQRETWQAPAYTTFAVSDAETGVNSTTDASNTFS